MRNPTVWADALLLPCGLRRALPGRADPRWRGRRARRDHRPQPASRPPRL